MFLFFMPSALSDNFVDIYADNVGDGYGYNVSTIQLAENIFRVTNNDTNNDQSLKRLFNRLFFGATGANPNGVTNFQSMRVSNSTFRDKTFKYLRFDGNYGGAETGSWNLNLTLNDTSPVYTFGYLNVRAGSGYASGFQRDNATEDIYTWTYNDAGHDTLYTTDPIFFNPSSDLPIWWFRAVHSASGGRAGSTLVAWDSAVSSEGYVVWGDFSNGAGVNNGTLFSTSNLPTLLAINAIDDYTTIMYEQTDISNFTVSITNGTNTYNDVANTTLYATFNESLNGLWNLTFTHDDYNTRIYEDVNLTGASTYTGYLYSTHEHIVNSTYWINGDTWVDINAPDTTKDHLTTLSYNTYDVSYYKRWYISVDTNSTNNSNVSYVNSAILWAYKATQTSSAPNRWLRTRGYDPYNCVFNESSITYNNPPDCSFVNVAETTFNVLEYHDFDLAMTEKPKAVSISYYLDSSGNNGGTYYSSRSGLNPPYAVVNYSSNFTIAVVDELSGSPLDNATITVAKYDNASFNRTDYLGSETSFVYPFDAGIYDISVEVDGTLVSFSNYDLATQSNYLSVEIAPHYLNLSIYNWSSYPTLSLMNQTVDITITGADIEYFENTSNGSLEGYFNAGDYTLKLESTGYETNYYFFNLDGYTDMSTYMFEIGDCDDVDFTIQDIAGTVIEDAKLSFYKQINFTWVVVTEKYSDISGIATVCLDNEDYKLYVEKEGFATWVGEFTPTQSSYTISLAGVSGGTFSFQDIFGGISFYYTPTELNQFGLTNFSLTVSTINNNVQEFSITSLYDGVYYTTLVSGSLAGGQATIELPLDNSQRFFNVSLYIESVDNQTFNSIVYFQSFNFTPSNYSLLVLAEEWIGTEDGFTVTFLTYLFVIIILALLFSAGAPLFAGYGVGVFLIGTLAFVGLIPASMATVTCILLVGLMVVSSEGWL